MIDERVRTYAAIGKATPICPLCEEALIARPIERRLREANRYVECFNGHVWLLEPKEEE